MIIGYSWRYPTDLSHMIHHYRIDKCIDPSTIIAKGEVRGRNQVTIDMETTHVQPAELFIPLSDMYTPYMIQKWMTYTPVE